MAHVQLYRHSHRYAAILYCTIFPFLEHCSEAPEFGQTILVVNQITTCITNKKDLASDDSRAKMSKVGSDPAQAPVKTSLVAVAHR